MITFTRTSIRKNMPALVMVAVMFFGMVAVTSNVSAQEAETADYTATFRGETVISREAQSFAETEVHCENRINFTARKYYGEIRNNDVVRCFWGGEEFRAVDADGLQNMTAAYSAYFRGQEVVSRDDQSLTRAKNHCENRITMTANNYGDSIQDDDEVTCYWGNGRLRVADAEEIRTYIDTESEEADAESSEESDTARDEINFPTETGYSEAQLTLGIEKLEMDWYDDESVQAIATFLIDDELTCINGLRRWSVVAPSRQDRSVTEEDVATWTDEQIRERFYLRLYDETMRYSWSNTDCVEAYVAEHGFDPRSEIDTEQKIAYVRELIEIPSNDLTVGGMSLNEILDVYINNVRGYYNVSAPTASSEDNSDNGEVDNGEVSREALIAQAKKLIEQLNSRVQYNSRTEGFVIGSRVQTTDRLKVRIVPGLDYELLGTQSAMAVGTIIQGPYERDGYTWYKVDYDQGRDGWSAGNWLRPIAQASASQNSRDDDGYYSGSRDDDDDDDRNYRSRNNDRDDSNRSSGSGSGSTGGSSGGSSSGSGSSPNFNVPSIGVYR